jgi:hypothetical protein
MKPPKLPRTVFANEAVDDSITAWMLGNKVGAVVDNIINNNPKATVLAYSGFAGSLLLHLAGGDERQFLVRN